MSNEHDYPGQIKQLLEDVRFEKEKARDYEEKFKREVKNSMQIHEYMVRLEQTCRELKAQFVSKRNWSPSPNEDQIEASNDQPLD